MRTKTNGASIADSAADPTYSQGNHGLSASCALRHTSASPGTKLASMSTSSSGRPTTGTMDSTLDTMLMNSITHQYSLLLALPVNLAYFL